MFYFLWKTTDFTTGVKITMTLLIAVAIALIVSLVIYPLVSNSLGDAAIMYR